MDFTKECSSPTLLMTMGMIKNILNIIKIIVPIILLIWATIGFIDLMKNPDDDKKNLKKVINKFLAAAIVFFIPTFVNITMNIIGINTDISTCWMNSAGYRIASTGYVPITDKERKSIFPNKSDYEKGDPSAKGCGAKIAKLAVELAGTATPDAFIVSPSGENYCAFNKSNDPRLSKYNQIHDSRVKCNGAYASCTQAAATIIDAAADPEINWMGPPQQLYYLQHSSKWQELTKPADEPWSKYLKPGDVGEVLYSESSGHSWIYVGNEIARKRFPNTDGYIYEGGYSACKNPYISASPGLVDSDNNIHYFRFKGNCSEADKKNVKDGYGGPKDYGC